MNTSRYVARSNAIAARALGDETMVMSATNSTLFTLNEVATTIWEAADGMTPLDEIVKNKVCAQYEVELEAALKDAEALIEGFASHGLLLVSDIPIAKVGHASQGVRMSLVLEMTAKALKMNIPLSVQLDLTYRCNERCVHCYLDHDDHGEMTTAEIKNLLDQMADAGVFYLTISGGEILMRRDFFEILEHARLRTFCIKLKTNGVLIREKEAARLRELGVESVQISIYSHRPEVHDAITKMPGSLRQSIEAVRFLREQGLYVTMANVLMTQNAADYKEVRLLAQKLDAKFIMDPTVTPMMDGDRSILELNVDQAALKEVFRNQELVGNVEEFCAPPAAVVRMIWIPCRAVRDIPRATSLRMAMSIPACNFPCPAEMCGKQNLWISGGFAPAERSSHDYSARHAFVLASAPTAPRVRDARASHISKETCAGLPRRIAKNRSREPEFPAKI